MKNVRASLKVTAAAAASVAIDDSTLLFLSFSSPFAINKLIRLSFLFSCVRIVLFPSSCDRHALSIYARRSWIWWDIISVRLNGTSNATDSDDSEYNAPAKSDWKSVWMVGEHQINIIRLIFLLCLGSALPKIDEPNYYVWNGDDVCSRLFSIFMQNKKRKKDAVETNAKCINFIDCRRFVHVAQMRSRIHLTSTCEQVVRIVDRMNEIFMAFFIAILLWLFSLLSLHQFRLMNCLQNYKSNERQSTRK